jgi:hypothetical protein
MDVRRKAGDMLKQIVESLQGADDKYSARIRDMYKDANPVVRTLGTGIGGGLPSLRKATLSPFTDNPVVRDKMGRPVGRYGPETYIGQKQRQLVEYGLPAVNAVPKYVIPAAGVALAGRGVMDIAAGFGGPADEQEPGQLSMLGSVGLGALTAAAFATPSVSRGMDESSIPVNKITEVNTRGFR